MKTFEETKQYISETCHKYIKEPFEIRYNFKDTTYLGRCQFFSVPRLTFNVPYIKYCIEHGELDEFKTTVLHEIAHVLAGEGHNHDSPWKKIMKSLGINNPQRLSTTTYRIPNKWKITCPYCGRTYEAHRKPKKGTACGECCKKYNNGKYSPKCILRVEKL